LKNKRLKKNQKKKVMMQALQNRMNLLIARLMRKNCAEKILALYLLAKNGSKKH